MVDLYASIIQSDPLALYLFMKKQNIANTEILYDSQLCINHINIIYMNHKYVSEMSR